MLRTSLLTHSHIAPMSLLLAALFVLAPIGCTSIRSPEIQVTGIRLTEQTDEAIALDITMSVHNPNEEPLRLVRFEYAFEVDGQHVFQGMRAAEATLSSQGTHELIIPVVAPNGRTTWQPGVVPGSFQYAIDGNLHYIAPGELAELLLDTGVRRPKVRFRDRGVIETNSADASADSDGQPSPPS